jgi:hypothetical protein
LCQHVSGKIVTPGEKRLPSLPGFGKGGWAKSRMEGESAMRVHRLYLILSFHLIMFSNDVLPASVHSGYPPEILQTSFFFNVAHKLSKCGQP